jgi:hypothetical protein
MRHTYITQSPALVKNQQAWTGLLQFKLRCSFFVALQFFNLYIIFNR